MNFVPAESEIFLMRPQDRVISGRYPRDDASDSPLATSVNELD
jgi:hypothetical protein